VGHRWPRRERDDETGEHVGHEAAAAHGILRRSWWLGADRGPTRSATCAADRAHRLHGDRTAGHRNARQAPAPAARGSSAGVLDRATGAAYPRAPRGASPIAHHRGGEPMAARSRALATVTLIWMLALLPAPSRDAAAAGPRDAKTADAFAERT